MFKLPFQWSLRPTKAIRTTFHANGRHQAQFRFFRKYRHLEKMILFPAKRFSGFQFQLLQLLQFALCFLWLRLAFLALSNVQDEIFIWNFLHVHVIKVSKSASATTQNTVLPIIDLQRCWLFLKGIDFTQRLSFASSYLIKIVLSHCVYLIIIFIFSFCGFC